MEIEKVDHLVLLIGSNPLPNTVAGILLTHKDSMISLIHSKAATPVAERLKQWLKARGFQEAKFKEKEIEESDPTSIFNGVRSLLDEVSKTKIGLNYTGGTKAMSVHTYRAVEYWAKERREKGEDIVTTFSYLNPRRLEMVIDPAEPQNAQSGTPIPMNESVELKLNDLLNLHGWSLKHEANAIADLPDSAAALATICANEESLKEWKTWVHGEMRGKCRREDRPDKWKSETTLPEKIALPVASQLEPFINVLQEELKFSDSLLSLQQSVFANEAKKFCEWLDGKWLEHHVLKVISEISSKVKIHEFLQNVEPHEVQFDVDVTAIRGYQLFAISCSTDNTKGILKSKLFEAYIRARQLGGDEARVALICCFDKPKVLEDEMRRDIDPEGRIRVFGQKHLAQLDTHLGQWIEDQSKGV